MDTCIATADEANWDRKRKNMIGFYTKYDIDNGQIMRLAGNISKPAHTQGLCTYTVMHPIELSAENA